MRRGFTLLEVVIALLVLELAVVGGVGLLALASATLGGAERLERAVALAEGAIDSLAHAASPVDGATGYGGGEVRWSVGAAGEVRLVARGPLGDTLFDIGTVLPPP